MRQLAVQLADVCHVEPGDYFFKGHVSGDTHLS